MERGPTFQEDQYGDLSKERIADTTALNVDLALARCQRKKVQPRDYILAMVAENDIAERFSEAVAAEMTRRAEALPDFNFDDPEDLERARQALSDVALWLKSRELDDPEASQHFREHAEEVKERMHEAGMFTYEIEESWEGRIMRLHVPTMASAPRVHELRQSLHALADVLAQDPTLMEVRMNSLLLEHPVAKRLGFQIDESAEFTSAPVSSMPRQEFIERFGVGK